MLCGNCVYTCKYLQSVGALEFVSSEKGTMAVAVDGKKVSETQCVGCGQCVQACPAGAIQVRRSVDKVLEAILDENTVVSAQIAPSVRVGISAEMGQPLGENTIGMLVDLLRTIGFDKVYDTIVGADLTIIEEGNELLERVASGKNLPLLTSCCPAWVKFCETYYPEFSANISTCRSPHRMMGAIIRHEFNKNTEMQGKKLINVSVMPCTAKKEEILRKESMTDGIQDLDYVLTSSELSRLIDCLNIDIKSLITEQADIPYSVESGSGVIFGASGGVLESALRYITGDAGESLKSSGARGDSGIRELSIDLNGRIIKAAIISGLKNAETIMDQLRSGKAEYDVIEVMACPGGCIMGGGQPTFDPYEWSFMRDKRRHGIYDTDEKSAIVESTKNLQAKALSDTLSEHERHELLHRNLS